MYIRPHLDYGDIIYHNQVKDSMDILEAIQYKAALIVSGCWKGTYRTKLYAELGWERLSDRRHIRRLMFHYRINAHLTPSYLKNCVDRCPPASTLRFKNHFSPTARVTGTFFQTMFVLSHLLVSSSPTSSSQCVPVRLLILVFQMFLVLSFLPSCVLI